MSMETSSNSSSGGGAAEPSVEDEFLRMLQSRPNGLPDSILMAHFPDSKKEEVVQIINEYILSNRIQISTLNTPSGQEIIYKYFHEELAVKLQGLGPEQYTVYQIIEASQNKGVWTRDIKIRTNIQQQVLNKTLKVLEQRQLIKTVRSVMSKSKKLYMLFDLEPAKEISGGPWYTDQEFDVDFIERLSDDIVNFIKSKSIAGIDQIGQHVRISGVSKVELTPEELLLVVQTLLYDGRIEECRNEVLALSGLLGNSGKTQYKVSREFFQNVNIQNSAYAGVSSYFTEIPCGVCTLISRCHTGGIISPERCEYMTTWLNYDRSEVVKEEPDW